MNILVHHHVASRVLFMVSQPFFQWRGSPIRVLFDVLALAASGLMVDLLVLPVGEKKDVPGVRVIRLLNPFRIRRVPIGPSIGKAIFDVLLFFKSLRLAMKHRYDVIHAVEDAGILGLVVARLTGAKLIFERHSEPSAHRRGLLRNLLLFFYSKVETFTARHADAVIGTGPGLVEQVRLMTPEKPVYHIFDIPSSLVDSSPEKSAAIRRRLVRGKDEVLATYIGSFAVYQGVEMLFESIPLAVARRPKLRFIIIGGTAREIAARRRWLGERGIEPAVTFLGTIPPDKVPDYLRASDILISPRIAGVNTPLKLLDYLKAGRAIVATTTEANRLIVDDETALLVEPNPEALAAGVCQLAGDPEWRHRLGANGRRLIERRYNYGEFQRRLRDCYRSVLESPAPVDSSGSA